MDENEFKSTKIEDKVTFYKKPIEYLDVFKGLTELKDYTVISKYHKDSHGPILKTFTILDDYNRPHILHHSFFLAKNTK